MERASGTTMETYTYDNFTEEELAMMETINMNYDDEDEDVEPCHWYATPDFDTADEV